MAQYPMFMRPLLGLAATRAGVSFQPLEKGLLTWKDNICENQTSLGRTSFETATRNEIKFRLANATHQVVK
jgi:hypothetical protein